MQTRCLMAHVCSYCAHVSTEHTAGFRYAQLQLENMLFRCQAHCGDPAVDAKVNEKVAQFCAAAAKHPDKVHQVGRERKLEAFTIS